MGEVKGRGNIVDPLSSIQPMHFLLVLCQIAKIKYLTFLQNLIKW